MGYTSFTCVERLIHMCNKTHSYVTYLIFTCAIRYTAFSCATRLIHMFTCATRLIVTCATWLIHMCDKTHTPHSHVRYTALTCATRLIHMCDVTKYHVRNISSVKCNASQLWMSRVQCIAIMNESSAMHRNYKLVSAMHRNYAWVTLHVKESCHVWKRVMSHMNESFL